MPQEITYYCSFCDKKETVESPTTFSTRYGGDIEDAACPEHADAMAFLADQCPGCVSGWGECGLFMAVGNNDLSDDDLATIKAGRCPHRVNGTMSFSAQGMRKIDLSETSKAGEAFLRAYHSA